MSDEIQRIAVSAGDDDAPGLNAVTMVALDPPEVKTVPLSTAVNRMKTVPLGSDTICTARELGLCLGDVWE